MARTKDYRPSTINKKLNKEIERVKEKGPRKVLVDGSGTLRTVKQAAKEGITPEVTFITEKKSLGAPVKLYQLAETMEDDWGAVIVDHPQIQEALPITVITGKPISYIEWNSELSAVRQVAESLAEMPDPEPEPETPPQIEEPYKYETD